MENKDKRDRTRVALKNALIELCDEKSYYEITIWDICNKAQMYRSTFYRYYDTKDEMLREIEHEYLDTTRALTATVRDYRANASPEQERAYLAELTADMEYHMKHEKLCRFLLSPAGDIYFYQKMKESIAETARHSAEKYGYFTNGDVDYRINFFAAGFIDTIHTWLQLKDRSPEQIAVILMDVLKSQLH